MFKRKGADLYMEREITLFEALAGTRFEFLHLDGRPVLVSTPPKKIIGHGETMCVEELGMPFFGRTYKYGNLFVIFSVTFPQTLTKAQIKTIKAVLHSKEDENRWDPAVKQEFKLKQFQGTEKDLLAKFRKRCMLFLYITRVAVDMEEEDEEGEGIPQGAQRIECGNQ